MIGLDSSTDYIATDTLLKKFLHLHQDKFELFRALGLKKSNIAEQKIREILNKEINKLEIKTMFKPLSESDDINRYIN